MDEREYEELREKAEYGRKAKIANEIFDDLLVVERAHTIGSLESGGFPTHEDLDMTVLYLRLLKKFEMSVKSYIDMGEIAEKELDEHGK